VKSKKKPLSELAEAMGDLEEEIGKIEALTRRMSKLELDSQKTIVGAAELLKEAAESHGRFAASLRTVVEGVDSIRQRQNASAATLSELASALDERRRLYEGLQERFVTLGEEARRVTSLFEGGGGEDKEQLLAKMRAAAEALSPVVESARSLATDAAGAGITDLQRDADALRQQLHALAQKLRKAAPPPDPDKTN
jgi:hypothetical protein